LASNSLLEGLVFGNRIASVLRSELLPAPILRSAGWRSSPALPDRPLNWLWVEVQQLMWDNVGIIREAVGLQVAIARLQQITRSLSGALLTKEGYQVANLATVALLVAKAALVRTESRGGHYRSDFPNRDDAQWRHHVTQRRS